jgi:hypothetical protein
MTVSTYQQTNPAPPLAAPPSALTQEPAHERRENQDSCARADRADDRWFVRVALTADATAVVRSVCVIVDDRDAQRIVLHTVWEDCQDVPLLAAHIASPIPAIESLDNIAWDLAAALLISLQQDAAACLEALGTPTGSLPAPHLGPLERAAMRSARDAAIY